MKQLFLLCIGISLLTSQPHYSILFEKQYHELGITSRIDNSGMYALSSFDVQPNGVYLRHFDEPLVTVVRNGSIAVERADDPLSLDISKSFVPRSLRKNKPAAISALQNKNIRSMISYAGSTASLFSADGGTFTGVSGESIRVAVKDRKNLSIRYGISGMDKEFHLLFPSDLAYADLIGIDARGNSFLLVERYRSEIPLKVRREVYTLSPEGEVLSVLSVPMIKYCVMVKEFEADSSGALFHLLAARDGIHLIRWDGLTRYTRDTVLYPKEFQFEEHYNDLLPVSEAPGDRPTGILTAANRQTALRLGEQYALHTYTCSAANLSPSDVTGPDGDVVRTPGWLVNGINARVAYRWGGFNTLSQYDAGLAAGKYAGDINTAGVSSYAVGVDCSGFVSRCWQMTYHSSTADMPSITTQYTSWDSLKPGDAIHKVGHVRLFVEKMSNGSLRVVESSGRGWDVSYWSYAPSDLNGVYTPRYYNGMESQFSLNRPELVSASIVSDSTVRLAWKGDTTNVEGYRIYASAEGTQWNLMTTDSVIHDTTVVLPLKNSYASYRVSSVLRSASAVEGLWSNALSAGSFLNSSKILIVDGFERNSAPGSWQGAVNTFAARYGAAIGTRMFSYESIKNTQLDQPQFQLSQYTAVFWMLGDESTTDETFSSAEQSLVKEYLHQGGHLFVSGSEIGWDLSAKGTATDKEFYSSYLKALYRSDDAGSGNVAGVGSPIFTKCSFTIGQAYEEDYPDEIDTAGGSTICFRYGNQKVAGICYSGIFGTGIKPGGLVYLAFPLETTASDSGFRNVVDAAMEYFDPLSPVEQRCFAAITDFSLSQNYPNPFNPSTMIIYQLPMNSDVTVKVYDVIGREIAVLFNGMQQAGSHQVEFNASHLPSGLYFYFLQAKNFHAAKKMVLVK